MFPAPVLDASTLYLPCIHHAPTTHPPCTRHVPPYTYHASPCTHHISSCPSRHPSCTQDPAIHHSASSIHLRLKAVFTPVTHPRNNPGLWQAERFYPSSRCRREVWLVFISLRCLSNLGKRGSRYHGACRQTWPVRPPPPPTHLAPTNIDAQSGVHLGCIGGGTGQFSIAFGLLFGVSHSWRISARNWPLWGLLILKASFSVLTDKCFCPRVYRR